MSSNRALRRSTRRLVCWSLVVGVGVACGGTRDPYTPAHDKSPGTSGTSAANSSAASSDSADTGQAGGSSAPTEGGSGSTDTTVSTAVIYPDAQLGVFPMDRVLDVQITMPDGAWDAAIAQAKEEQYTRVSVSIDGQALGDVGFRFKGSYSLESCIDEQGKLICEKLSQKLRFNSYDPDKRFYGLKRLNFNALTREADLVREHLGYRLFGDMGVLVPRTAYAVITVNGQSEGLFHVVEDVDGRFTDDRFEKGNRDGNLYKEGWPDHTDDSYYDYHYATGEPTATHQIYETFSREMLAASDVELPSVLGRWMDTDYLLSYMAVDYAIANWDGITTFYCGDWGCSNHNYFIYQEQLRPRFWLIPWDLNATFSVKHWLGNIVPWNRLDVDCSARVPTENGPLTTKAAACDPTIRAIALSRDGYHAAVRRLLDQYFVPTRLNQQIDEIVTLLGPYVANDPYLSSSALNSNLSYFKNQIGDLRARLEAVLTE